MMSNPFASVSLPASITTLAALNTFLGELESVKSFDDINIVGGRNVIVKSSGMVYRVGERKLKSWEVEAIAGLIGKGSNVPTDVKAMRQLDPSYQFTWNERVVYRYRVNVSALRASGEQQIKITMRAIRADIPSLEYVRISEEEFSAMTSGAGLVIISGETGSGKTTTLAGVIGEIIRRAGMGGRGKVICTYEQPVEFMYERLVDETLNKEGSCNVEVYQHEIGLDLPSFGEGIRNALRSNPDIILLGEARELETISAALTFALSGHLVFITTHAKGVIATLMRLISEFPESRQTSAFLSFLSCTKMIISQQLAPSEKCGRVPIREKLLISDAQQGAFALCHEFAQANVMFAEHFNKNGATFKESARQMYESGLINDGVMNHYSQAEFEVKQ